MIRRQNRRCLAFLVLACACAGARADPNDYILDLDFEEGEYELEAKLGAASSTPDGTPPQQAAAFSFGHGLSSAWFSEAYLQFANDVSGVHGGGLDSLSWENIVRFTEQGEWPVDLGAMLEIERPRGADNGVSVTFGPLLQTDFDLVQVNANVLFQRVIGGYPYGTTQVGYQYQVKYRQQAKFEYGIQGFGSVGTWNSWGQLGPQSHRLGPAVFGKFRVGPGRAIKYNAAFLFGTSSGAPSGTLRAQIEYEF